MPLLEIITGDQIKIIAGLIMPAHCLLLKGEGVSVSEEAITQDSKEIKKLPFDACKLKAQENFDREDHKSEEPLQSNQRETTSPIILAESQIQTGEGYALVLDFADDSSEQQPGTVKAESSPKDFQQGAFHQLSKYVFYCCCVCAGVTLTILVLRFIIGEAVRGFEFSSRIDNYIEECYRYILIALSIIYDIWI